MFLVSVFISCFLSSAKQKKTMFLIGVYILRYIPYIIVVIVLIITEIVRTSIASQTNVGWGAAEGMHIRGRHP